jgi:DNA invertase Pin-like site-specific DNA recombinase
LRDAARDGLVDLVLMHDPDRLSRKYAYQVLLLEEFKRWQVDILSRGGTGITQRFGLFQRQNSRTARFTAGAIQYLGSL